MVGLLFTTGDPAFFGAEVLVRFGSGEAIGGATFGDDRFSPTFAASEDFASNAFFALTDEFHESLIN